jgi:hypothetical protein
MQASEYYAQLQLRERQSTVATYRPTVQDIKRATGSTAVDFHIEQSTAKE